MINIQGAIVDRVDIRKEEIEKLGRDKVLREGERGKD